MEDQERPQEVLTNSLKPREFPPKPQRVLEFYSLDDGVRVKMNANGDDYRSFWLDPEVKTWFDARDKVIGRNWQNRRMLMALAEKGDQAAAMVLELYKPEHYLFPIELKNLKRSPDKSFAQAEALAKQLEDDL